MSRVSDQSLQGQIALVVGGLSPAGQAIASRLAGQGALVMLTDFSDAESMEAAERLAADGLPVQGMGMDVTLSQSVNAAFDLIADTYGPPSLLYYGIGLHLPLPTCEVLPEQWQQALLANLGGAWLCANAYFRGLRARRIRRGTIVFLLSDLGDENNDAMTLMTHDGIAALARAIQKNWKGPDIASYVLVGGPLEGSGAERILQARAQAQGIEWDEFLKRWIRKHGRRFSRNPTDIAEYACRIAHGEFAESKERLLRVAPSRAAEKKRKGKS